MDLKEAITELVEEQLKDTNYFLVEVALSGQKKVAKIAIILDGDEGISIDTCAKISRVIGNQIEAKDLIPQAYTLEVSSPGLDQPLRLLRQYRRNVGRMVKVHLPGGVIKRGKLEAVNENVITILEEPEKKKKGAVPVQAVIPLTEVEKTYVIPALA